MPMNPQLAGRLGIAANQSYVSKDTVPHPRLFNTRAVWGSMLEVQQLRGTRAPQCSSPCAGQPSGPAQCVAAVLEPLILSVTLSTSARQHVVRRTRLDEQ